MHMPRPLFELRRFVFALQYKFIKAFNSDINDKRGLQSVSIALFCFVEIKILQRCQIIIITFVYCAGADLHPLVNNTMTQ